MVLIELGVPFLQSQYLLYFLETFGPSLDLTSLFACPFRVFGFPVPSVIVYSGESCHGRKYFEGAEDWCEVFATPKHSPLRSFRDSLEKYDQLQDSARLVAVPNGTELYPLRSFAGWWPLPR